jgi:hypothetical protein
MHDRSAFRQVDRGALNAGNGPERVGDMTRAIAAGHAADAQFGERRCLVVDLRCVVCELVWHEQPNAMLFAEMSHKPTKSSPQAAVFVLCDAILVALGP